MTKIKAEPVTIDTVFVYDPVAKQEGKPWDVKRLILSVGRGEEDPEFITFEIFDDSQFSIFSGAWSSEGQKWLHEEIDIDAARRLRDFLNYAVPK